MAAEHVKIDFYGRVLCMPLALLISFSMFQCLLTMCYKRKREFYGCLLLSCGFGAFASLIPFAHENDTIVNDLNDISETLSVMTFLVQITMIGRDINKKMRIRSLKWLTHVSEALVFASIFVAVKDLIELPFPSSKLDFFDPLSNALEEVSLWFIFCFRLYFIAISRGFKVMLHTKKAESAMYVLFVTHEYPFALLNRRTGLSWEQQQALWHRLTMALCLLHTVREKLRSSSSKVTKGETQKSMAPSNAEVSRKSFVSNKDAMLGSRAPTFVNLAKRVVMHGPSMAAIVPAKT